MKKYGSHEEMIYQAPVIGAVIGGLVGGGGTLAGIMSVGGLVGSAIGAVAGGTLLGGAMKSPKMPSIAAPATPAVPQATAMPATPQTPAATPVSQAPTGGSSPATLEDISKGEMNARRRRGRLSTILTNQATNSDASGGEEVELLGNY